jgi:hypothetical protein
MMPQTFTQDGVVYEDLGNGQVRVVGYQDQPEVPQSVRIGSPDPRRPYQVRKDAAEAVSAEAEAPYAAAIAQAQAAKATAEAERARAETAKTTAADNTAATRKEAIAAYKATEQLDQLIAGIEARYSEGPGTTKGIMGVQDYLPTESNRRFDTAGDAVRGAAITALGFSSGQTNSPTEVAMNVDPYIPKAGDYDQVILDKIARLKELRDRARQQAVATLGGVPDQNGVITPLPAAPSGAPPGTPPAAPPTGGGDLPPGMDRSTKWIVDPTAIERTGVTVPKGNSAAEAAKTGNFGSRLQDNPALKGVNARINALLKSNAPVDRIADYMRSVGLTPPPSLYAAAAWRTKHPEYRGNYSVNMDDMEVPLNGWQWMMNNAGRSAPGAALMNYTDAILPVGVLPGAETNKAIIEGARQEHPTASLVGTVGGAATAAGGIEAGLARVAARAPGAIGTVLRSPRTADALYGAYSGATHSDDPLTGGATGMLFGVGGGMFGRAATRGTGNAFQGVRNEAVRELNARGIPLTVGQALSQSGRLGNVIKGVEDRMTGLPIVGDMVTARRREGLEAFNRSAFDEGLAPIGGTTNGVTQEQGVELAKGAVGRAYDDALDGVDVSLDPRFAAEEAAARQLGARIPGFDDQYTFTYDRRVAPNILPPVPAPPVPGGGLSVAYPTMTGKGYQASLRGLDADARAAINGNNMRGNDFADALGLTRNALTGAAERSAPGVAPALQAANQAYRQTGVLRDAVNAARNGQSGEVGLFTPAQLSNAAAVNAKRFGGSQGTTSQPFFDLTRAGQQVLPNKVPDSGTAGRLMAYAMPATIVGGTTAGGYAAGGGEGAQTGAGLSVGALAVAAAGGSKPAQAALRKMLLDRPDLAVTIGNQIQQRARIGGMFGAGAGIGLLPQQ